MRNHKLLLLNVFLFSMLNDLHSQNISDSGHLPKLVLHSVTDYPEGLYTTLEEFITKSPGPLDIIERRNLQGSKMGDDTLSNQVFFYKDTIGRAKLKNVFAVSYHGNLYIQQRYIVKYFNKDDRKEDGNNDNSFHRVINDGKFLYLEGQFANGLAKGLARGLGGIGGAVIYASVNNMKGVIFDFEKKEFAVFKNCNDFIDFLIDHGLNANLDCENEKFDIKKVREVIVKVIK